MSPWLIEDKEASSLNEDLINTVGVEEDHIELDSKIVTVNEK